MDQPKYHIPSDLKRAIEESESTRSARNSFNKFSPVLRKLKTVSCLEIAECHFLQLLKLGLYLEEYQQRQDMKRIEISESTIERVHGTKRNFKIYIKGLDEDDPILSVSDTFKVYDLEYPDTVFFLRVSEIYKDHVIVTGDNKFCNKHSCFAEYDIKHIFNNYTFQCCHSALSRISSSMISNFFFPKKKTAARTQELIDIQTWFNEDVSNNPEQRQAVCSIINKSSFPAPYILYGPPGTGKTSTLVEAICQIWKQLPHRKCILICAPSNAACDVITKRLLHYIPADDVYRIYSLSQNYNKIDPDIRKCCNCNADGSVDDLEECNSFLKKIIITTLCTSFRLSRLMQQISHVFIDEASQATLPEAFLPLCAVRGSLLTPCQVVISGDHQQLGPGIRSKLAEPILGQSILEKLMKHEPYQKDEKTGYDPRYVTKLIRNFRSVKEIVQVPNALFYDNELIACNNTKLSTFPVAFYAVEGKEQKAYESKSSYNEEEINKVLFQVKRFIGRRIGDKTISGKDIGIVTPFSLQASQIRKKLRVAGLKDVDVGTVEIYQGQEKEVIIVTTVRSKTFVHSCAKHIGFLSNPKRFNVALTRAKSCLVVVGNPNALKVDKNWRLFLRFCQENDAYHGDSFVLESELHYLMKELSIDSKSNEDSTDLFERSLDILTIDDGYSSNRVTSLRNYSIRNPTLGEKRRTVIRKVPSFSFKRNSSSDETDDDGYVIINREKKIEINLLKQFPLLKK